MSSLTILSLLFTIAFSMSAIALITLVIGPVALILYLHKEIEAKSDYAAEQWDRARRPEYWAAIDAQRKDPQLERQHHHHWRLIP